MYTYSFNVSVILVSIRFSAFYVPMVFPVFLFRVNENPSLWVQPSKDAITITNLLISLLTRVYSTNKFVSVIAKDPSSLLKDRLVENLDNSWRDTVNTVEKA